MASHSEGRERHNLGDTFSVVRRVFRFEKMMLMDLGRRGKGCEEFDISQWFSGELLAKAGESEDGAHARSAVSYGQVSYQRAKKGGSGEK
jgi:hypothetical protein